MSKLDGKYGCTAPELKTSALTVYSLVTSQLCLFFYLDVKIKYEVHSQILCLKRRSKFASTVAVALYIEDPCPHTRNYYTKSVRILAKLEERMAFEQQANGCYAESFLISSERESRSRAVNTYRSFLNWSVRNYTFSSEETKRKLAMLDLALLQSRVFHLVLVQSQKMGSPRSVTNLRLQRQDCCVIL